MMLSPLRPVPSLSQPTQMDLWHFTFTLFVSLANLAKPSNALIRHMFLITEAEWDLPFFF